MTSIRMDSTSSCVIDGKKYTADTINEWPGGEPAKAAQPDAAEMQRQVDGLTRNQRRALVKRMKKAKK